MLDQSLSASEYEEDANRISARLGATIDQLRTNLAPSSLADALARRSGLRDVSPASAFDFAARRHPVPTALVGIGIGLWAYSLARSRSTHRGEPGAQRSLRDAAGSLARSATGVLRDRAAAKRQAFVTLANAHVRAAAAQLSDAIENNVDDLVGEIPAAPTARAFMASAIQMALFATFDALLSKPGRNATAE